MAHRAGITKAVGPHSLRHAFITAALDDRARVSLDRHATYIVAAFVAGAARFPLNRGVGPRLSSPRAHPAATHCGITPEHCRR